MRKNKESTSKQEHFLSNHRNTRFATISRNFLLISALLFAVNGCASLFISVADRDEARASIELGEGDSVAVQPVNATESTIENGWNDDLSQRLQGKIVEELKARGINARSGGGDGGATLQVTVSRFEKGSAVGRLFLFFGDTFLDGTAVLRSGGGKRELEIRKTGQAKGLLEMRDQTNKNIGYFATALASKITK